MSNSEKTEGELLPPLHLVEAYPDASSIFTVSLSPLGEIRDEALIVLDTNVLLVPYTVNPKSLEDIKRTYARLIGEERLFLPAQVAREFAKNRANKIGELFQQLSRKRNKLDSLQVGRYPLLEPLAEYNELLEIEKEIDEKVKQYRNAIGNILNHIRSWRWNDSVSDIYRELFQPAVIIDPKLELAEIETDLKRRNSNKIPPGFKDASKEDGGIGDLLIWHTILHLGRDRKRSIIFVSGEEKTDWWHRSEGEALYPRFELVDEFKRISDGKDFHIVKFSQLLDLFGAEEQVVEEVRNKEIAQSIITRPTSIILLAMRAEQAVELWLRNRYSPRELTKNIQKFPDFIVVLSTGRRLGVEVKAFRHSHTGAIWQRFRDVAYRGYYEINEGNIDAFTAVFVAESDEKALEVALNMERLISQGPPINVVIGYLDSVGEFIPIEVRDNIE